jgi:Protein of unknown function (DUF3684)
MKITSFLLGLRRKRKEEQSTTSANAEEDWDLERDDGLFKSDTVVIADDANAHQVFGDSVYYAPQEDLLEGMA